MAFKEVGNAKVTETVKPKELAVGASIEGYLVRFESSAKYPGTQAIIMSNGKGEQFRVSPHGNIKYAIRDGLLTVGYKTRITKLGDAKVKGLATTSFRIEQDDSDVLAGYEDTSEALLDEASIDPATLPTTGTTSRNAGNGVSKADLERNAIKARAAKLNQQATGNKN